MQAGRRARRVLKGKAEKSMARDRPSSWRAGGHGGCCGVSSEGASVHPVPERARGSRGALQFSPRSVTSLSPLLHPGLAPVKALPQPILHHTAAAAPWRWVLLSNTLVLLREGANDFADSFLAPSEAGKP